VVNPCPTLGPVQALQPVKDEVEPQLELEVVVKPQWGRDVDAFATRRPGETTVVVFEPRPEAA
jgi:hypothetical protein